MGTLKHEVTTSVLGEVEKCLPPPPTPTAPVASSSQGQLFGMPAITPTNIFMIFALHEYISSTHLICNGYFTTITEADPPGDVCRPRLSETQRM